MFDQLHNYCVEKKYPVYRKCPLLFDYLAILLHSSKLFSNYNTNNIKLLEALYPSALLMKNNHQPVCCSVSSVCLILQGSGSLISSLSSLINSVFADVISS